MPTTATARDRSRRRDWKSLAAIPAVVVLVAVVAACSQTSGTSAPTGTTTSTGTGTVPGSTAAATPAVTGSQCPYVVDQSKADFYPIQPSFSAGYLMSVQKLNSDTANACGS